ncbi:cellulase family glycosylhydrolase [Streptosporangium sp. NBC_01469]|uniref:cellulase family glycosylhydrolase n=1 Tax=Streptosporangium sp. NBC_01469 TaxID=2903898 RepID=UPI002E2E4CAB|nr:cellulase family glycosylhydrolase [Streptosporangium sp. NBC_01469]
MLRKVHPLPPTQDRPRRRRSLVAIAATVLTIAVPSLVGTASQAATAATATAPAGAAAAPAVGAAAIPDLTAANRRAPVPGLPDWSKAGYRGGVALPEAAQASPDAACHITAAELAAQFGVRADGSDATGGLQAAIDQIRTACSPAAGYTRLSSITLPEGRITVTRQLGLDADYLVLKGAGMGRTVLVFRPDANTRYDTLTADGSDWDEDGATHGSGKGGWTWPGRGLLRVQTREVASRYAAEYASAPANRKDIFEGSANQHWATGVPLREASAIGTNVIRLATSADMSRFKVGGHLWVGAANSVKFYQQQTVTNTAQYMNLHMRQQIFQITAVDTAGRNVTIDKPLEYDLPLDSTSDGSAAIAGTVYPSRVTPLKVVQGVGIEDLTITQDMTNMPKLGGGTYNLNRADAVHDYGNMAPEYAMHGIVLKWAANSWIRRVGTEMTGSHAVVTESAKNIQVQESSFDGSWNKGKGGNGYFRGSRVWDSLYAYNTSRNLRHFTFQWSASNNVVVGNDFDSDLNVHGGWERRNLFENNKVAVPFQHASKNCRTNCGDEGGGTPDDSSWWPIWWAAGPKAAKWSGSSGPQNVFYNNDLTKQTTQGGAYQPYYADRQRVYQFGSSASDPSKFQHLAVNGATIPDWASRETVNYTASPGSGVNATMTDASGSLFLRSGGGPGNPGDDTVAPSVPGNLRSTGTTANSVSLAWNAATDNVGVSGYEVYRGGTLVATVAGTSHTDTGLTASTSYSYTVRARDAAGNRSAAGAAVTAQTGSGGGGNEDQLISRGKPATASSIEGPGFEAGLAVDGNTTTRWASAEGSDPQWIQVDLGGSYTISRVRLDWEAAYGSAYRIEVSPNGTDWTSVYSTTSGDGTIDDLTVSGSARYVRVYGTARGTAWGYSLHEFDVYGRSNGGGPGDDTTAPSVPGNLRSTGTTANSVSLAWNAATDNVGVTGYEVYRGGTLVATASGTTHTDTGLTASTSYTYTVRARDAAGNRSAASAAVTAQTTTGGGGGGTPAAANGQLRVCGNRLCNEAGKQIQLRGMSTHGIQWYDQCLNNASLDALATDWKADILRISMYIQEGGYETNPRAFTDRVHQLIEMATARGMYALVDWHMLTPGDPNYNLSRARTFFTEIAQRHNGKKNVIYEIANEPNGSSVTWSVIRNYANQLVPVIRQQDPDAPILVGTPDWSSLGVSGDGDATDTIRANPVSGTNIMYTFHFYAASHGTEYLNALSRAADLLPIFVTEFGTQTASGDGGNNFSRSQQYLDLMAQKKISWTNWNYSDDSRTGAVFTAGTCPNGPYAGTSRLKEAGVWIRDRIRTADDF